MISKNARRWVAVAEGLGWRFKSHNMNQEFYDWPGHDLKVSLKIATGIKGMIRRGQCFHVEFDWWDMVVFRAKKPPGRGWRDGHSWWSRKGRDLDGLIKCLEDLKG